jgi:hypothetical protein
MTRLITSLIVAISLTFLPAARAAAPEDVADFFPIVTPDDPSVDADQAPATVSGIATWYDANRWTLVPYPHHMRTAYTDAGIVYYVAAGPALREFLGWRHWDDHFTVLVTSDLTGVQIVAEVVDWCSCGGHRGVDDNRLADLSPALFKALGAHLSRGVQPITIQMLP